VGLCVLVVDDEPDSLDIVKRVLEERGARVVACASAARALVELETKRHDVLVSDIAMPEMDGYALMKEVRRKGLGLPAVALTAFARVEDHERALRAGYQAHVSKPLDMTQLVKVVFELGSVRRRPEQGRAEGAS
jgi:CheY-like chemotaxis protein